VTSFLLAELEQRFDRINFCLHPNFTDVRSFNWFHYHEPQAGQFEIAVRYTGILDCTKYLGADDHLKSARSVRRQERNRALAQGFRVHLSDDVNRFAEIYELTFGRQGIELEEETSAQARRIWKTGLSDGFARLWACSPPLGAPVSMALFVYDQRCGYYLFGANDPAFRRTGASTLLLFEAIWRSRAEVGIQCVDFVGLNSPQRGDYKASFDAEPCPYYVASWRSRALAWGRQLDG
jgi:hypothetical protein